MVTYLEDHNEYLFNITLGRYSADIRCKDLQYQHTLMLGNKHKEEDKEDYTEFLKLLVKFFIKGYMEGREDSAKKLKALLMQSSD